MRKLLRNTKIVTFIIILIQLVCIGVFCILYFNNVSNIQSYIDASIILIIVCGIAIFDCLFIWIILMYISGIKSKTDLKAAEVIGSDVQEAYNFAMIGLAVTDDNDVVIWTNDLFRNRHINIIDSNIFDWQDKLATLKGSAPDTVCKILVNTRNYDVKYLADANLWIFKDTTDYESVVQYSKEQAPVVGLLSIDNYVDVIRSEDESNDVITKLKNVIFNYAKDFGLLLRKHRDDTYLILCNYETLMEMKADKFSILDKAREISRDEEIPLTISMGIAHDFPDVVKLNELAASALDIAMSRGGDQVVLSAYGNEMEFFGGKTEAQETRNRVKVRVLADSLIALMKNAGSIFVMGHKDMDMDSLGACLGIKALAKHLNITCYIIVDYKSTETKCRSALLSQFSQSELEDLILSPQDALAKVKPDSLLIVCDVHMPSMVMAPDMLEHVSKVVVIDHHRRAEEYINSLVFNHIDSSASSTCEIITEFLRFCTLNPRVELPSLYATIMLSGIFLDSTYFKSRQTGVRTFEAATILKESGADNALADDLLKDEYQEYQAIYKLMETMKTPYYGVVYIKGDDDTIYDRWTLAKAANTCLSVKGVNACFVFAKTNQKQVSMSCRSDGSVNVQILAEKLGGGGHFVSAGVTFEKTEINDVEKQLIEVLKVNLNEAKADAKSRKSEE